MRELTRDPFARAKSYTATLGGRGETHTRVVFRRWPESQGGSVIALFPDIEERRPGSCLSYERVGQHGEADYAGVVRATKPATLQELDTQRLYSELHNRGYRLVVKARR